MPPSLCDGVGSELGLLILMSWLKDGPVILESLGSELGLFLLLGFLDGLPSHLQCVRLRTVYLSLFLWCLRSELGPLPYS